MYEHPLFETLNKEEAQKLIEDAKLKIQTINQQEQQDG